MKKQISVVAGLLVMGSVNIGVLRAQPLDSATLATALPKTQLDVRRAEANARVTAFAIETLKSQSPADYARFPVALRDALPYALESQPFEAWSLDLQQFARENFRKLAADTQVEKSVYQAKNKAAVVQWLKEKAPFENTQLEFYLTVRVPFIGKNLDGVTVLEVNQQASIAEPGTPASRIIALGHLVNSLSPQQKSALFANNMHLPLAELTPQQKQDFDEVHKGHGDMKIDTPNGEISIHQSPKSDTAFDFRFVIIAQRNVAGKKDYFEVQIARPYDYLRR